ncbi:MFS transporter, partial [Escherichia coli]|uniref:MFS transporter n=1 Tax=Escherichia coli TaxID=562 RepID=UPI00215D86A0
MNQQLSWRTIVGYSLGDVANNFAFAMGALFLLSYYTDVAGVGAAAAGTMLLLVRVFDAFADVFAGRVVDSVNTRWGKFRPFLLFGTAPLMIFSVLVFWVPTDWSHGSKVVYAYLTYMGLGLCYSLVNIPYGSLATAMTQQPQSPPPPRAGPCGGTGLPALTLFFFPVRAGKIDLPPTRGGLRVS